MNFWVIRFFMGRKIISPLIISIGDNKIRRMIAHKLNVEFGTAIHPSAVVSSYATIQEGYSYHAGS